MPAKFKPWLIPPLPGESEASLWQRRHEAYFGRARNSDIPEWQRRIGPIDFAGKRVLEIGSGHGALCVAAAEAGAREVVGIDLDRERIDFAREYVPRSYPALAARIRFECVDIADLQGPFDLVLSKDTFEHVDDLVAMLGHIHRLLSPGGSLITGFSPLYYSPFGDHGRMEMKIPWAHAVLPEGWLLSRLSKRLGKPVRSVSELGLNQMLSSTFTEAVKHHDWASVQIAYNRSDKPAMKLFDVLRKLPPLERFFTVGIYARLKRA